MKRWLACVAAAVATLVGAGAGASGGGAAIARTVVIGHSVRGRPITAIVRGPDAAKRKLLVVGCIHGNECAGLRITSALARSKPVMGVQLWIVPEMNPDGTAADTRQNAHGVDLNRNFPYQWQRVTNPVYYSGPRPLSEPETRAAVRLIRRIKPTVTIWYHQHEDLVDMAGGDRGVGRRSSWSCRRGRSGPRRWPRTCVRSGRWSSGSEWGRGRAARDSDRNVPPGVRPSATRDCSGPGGVVCPVNATRARASMSRVVFPTSQLANATRLRREPPRVAIPGRVIPPQARRAVDLDM
jgi:murein peptide amidase A